MQQIKEESDTKEIKKKVLVLRHQKDTGRVGMKMWYSSC